MKANHVPARRGAPLLGAAFLTLALPACVSAPPPPAPAPAPVRPAPAAPAAPSAPPGDWRDAPVTPGDWEWREIGGQSTARFAQGLLELRCERDSGSVMILRAGAASGPLPMTVSTTSTRRVVTAQPFAGPPPVVAVRLAARDPLLDAMAFSRGRFAIEAAGLTPVYAPSWPEVSRVIEDCR